MSYVRKSKVFKLTFEDPELNGLVVRVRSVPLGRLLKLVKVVGLDAENLKADDLEMVDEILVMFSKALVGWNLENEDDDGVRSEVPATYEGVQSQDLDFVITIVSAWVEGMAGVSAPLAQRSSGGATFPEGSLPMEVLSPNQVS